jgi:polysaccharide export outer membrane protein
VIPPLAQMLGGVQRPALYFAAAAIAVALFGGCAKSFIDLDETALGIETKSLSPAVPPPPPKLQNGDKLRVTVFNEPPLSGEFTVDGAGSIAFPLIGQVDVAGLDAREVEERLTQRLSGRYLVNPKISVEILSYQPFYVMGEVAKSGEYPYRPGLNAVSAIALAGGFTPRAATQSVVIRRANEKSGKEVTLDPSVLVFPGDMITVPERLF